jgi:general secretion pathway protein A
MLFQTQQQGGTAILLIDEAHLMSVELLEEIRLLGNTDTYQEKLLQIVLCGQPELFAVLQRPELQALQQRIASTCLLRPLSLPETRAYMAERLHAAGLRGSSPFTGTAVEVIHRLTGGVPRLINLLSDACLLCGFELKRKQIDQFLVEQASEDVLGLLKGPFSPAGGLGSGASGKKAEAHSPAPTSAQPEEKPVPAASWPEQPPLQARAAAAAESPATFGIAPGLSSSATAVADERRGTKASPRDGNWTRSTFDVLIDALKQGRAVARE